MASFSKRVVAQADNGGSAGGWSTGNTNPGRAFTGTEVYAAWRFTSVTIPQGQTITSATLTLEATSNDSDTIHLWIYGIAEDNTASLSSDPDGRTKTTARRQYDQAGVTGGNLYVIDVTTIVQEILNRGGWASGNALAFITDDNGTSNNNAITYKSWTSFIPGDQAHAALLDVTWSGSSPSASLSPSISPSISPSSSLSPSASISPSASVSPSPLPPPGVVIVVSKPGINALKNSDPEKNIFDSRYGTLKYFTKQAVSLSFDASTLDISVTGAYTHNLGYYPFCEIFVRVYAGGTPSGNYEYVPFAGAGATILYSAVAKITTTQIVLYGMIDGISASIWHFDFLIFIYKNNLQL